jgi:hypothetical protein
MSSHLGYLCVVVALTGACMCLLHRGWRLNSAKGSCSLGIATKGPAAFQRKLIVVFGLLTLADTLQTNHLYKLYRHYGLAKEEIGTLFVASYIAGIQHDIHIFIDLFTVCFYPLGLIESSLDERLCNYAQCLCNTQT